MALSPTETVAIFTGLPAVITAIGVIIGTLNKNRVDATVQAQALQDKEDAQVRSDLAAERTENERLRNRLREQDEDHDKDRARQDDEHNRDRERWLKRIEEAETLARMASERASLSAARLESERPRDGPAS